MKTINTKSKRVDNLAKEAQELLSQGYEVVFAMSSKTKPERILKVMDATIGDYKVNLSIKDPKLKEYLKLGLVGTVIGAGGLGCALVYSAIVTGTALATITFPVALTVIGVGAVIGCAVGLGVATCYDVKIYKYRGETRMKIISVAA